MCDFGITYKFVIYSITLCILRCVITLSAKWNCADNRCETVIGNGFLIRSIDQQGSASQTERSVEIVGFSVGTSDSLYKIRKDSVYYYVHISFIQLEKPLDLSSIKIWDYIDEDIPVLFHGIEKAESVSSFDSFENLSTVSEVFRKGNVLQNLDGVSNTVETKDENLTSGNNKPELENYTDNLDNQLFNVNQINKFDEVLVVKKTDMDENRSLVTDDLHDVDNNESNDLMANGTDDFNYINNNMENLNISRDDKLNEIVIDKNILDQSNLDVKTEKLSLDMNLSGVTKPVELMADKIIGDIKNINTSEVNDILNSTKINVELENSETFDAFNGKYRINLTSEDVSTPLHDGFNKVLNQTDLSEVSNNSDERVFEAKTDIDGTPVVNLIKKELEKESKRDLVLDITEVNNTFQKVVVDDDNNLKHSDLDAALNKSTSSDANKTELDVPNINPNDTGESETKLNMNHNEIYSNLGVSGNSSGTPIDQTFVSENNYFKMNNTNLDMNASSVDETVDVSDKVVEHPNLNKDSINVKEKSSDTLIINKISEDVKNLDSNFNESNNISLHSSNINSDMESFAFSNDNLVSLSSNFNVITEKIDTDNILIDNKYLNLNDYILSNKLESDCFPKHIGLVQCIYWASYLNKNTTCEKKELNSISAWLLVNLVNYLFHVSNLFINYLPSNLSLTFNLILVDWFSFSLHFLIVWIVFLVHTIFLFLIGKYSFRYFFMANRNVDGRVLFDKSVKLEEENLKLVDELAEQKELVDELSMRNYNLLYYLEKCSTDSASQSDLIDLEKKKIQSKLSILEESYEKLDKESSELIFEKNQQISILTSDIERIRKENELIKENSIKTLTEIEDEHKQVVEKLKDEQDDLYSQARLYYTQMEAMRTEVDKILDSRKETEEKLLSTQTELESLLVMYNTLKTFETSLDIDDFLKEKLMNNEFTKNSMVDNDNEDNEIFVENGDLEDDEIDNVMDTSTNVKTKEAKLREKLSLVLDVGHLQAQLKLKDDQIKIEKLRADEEREQKIVLETKCEEFEKENQELRSNKAVIEEEKNSMQQKCNVLSQFFKEREMELLRDLSKNVASDLEFNETLSDYTKRNYELETETKVLRDRLAATRLELAQTEKSNRRQMNELSKRSHDNWLAARATEHQIKDLRDENTCLRQKLIDAERNCLPPALRALTENTMPNSYVQKPNLVGSSKLSDNRSFSKHSLSSHGSNTLEMRPMIYPMPPRMLPRGFQIPPPPPPPPLQAFLGMSIDRPPFSHGFMPPPPLLPSVHPPFPSMINSMKKNDKETSSQSSKSSQIH